jgi:hypothetical protein
MTQYGTWVSYGGGARIWLAAGLLVVAVGLAYAGTRLPLPARAAMPGRTALAIMLVAWVASIAASLVCAIIYISSYIHAYNLRLSQAAPPDRIAPVTLVAVALTFVAILVSSSHGSGAKLAGAVIGALAAPMVFELPFDLIVMARLYPPIPPDPAGYRALFVVPLFLMEITTLLLLWQSPMVQLTRATFFSFALMLGVFVVWALFGFGYPATALPITLNIVSKLLAFSTVLTMFFPLRPPAADPAIAAR